MEHVGHVVKDPTLVATWGISKRPRPVKTLEEQDPFTRNIKPYTKGVPCETCFCIVDINNISCLKSLSSHTGRIIHKLPAKTCKNLVSCRVLKLHQTLWSAGKTYLLVKSNLLNINFLFLSSRKCLKSQIFPGLSPDFGTRLHLAIFWMFDPHTKGDQTLLLWMLLIRNMFFIQNIPSF